MKVIALQAGILISDQYGMTSRSVIGIFNKESENHKTLLELAKTHFKKDNSGKLINFTELEFDLIE